MNRVELGKWGEKKAAAFLHEQGHCIVDRNFRCRFGEVDIISTQAGFLCFTEVKTRTSMCFGLPCEAVDVRKRAHLKNVAQYYLLSHPEYEAFSPRNDIIEILYLPERKYIRHLLGVF